MKALRSLYVQVLIAIALGILVGMIWPHFAVGLKVYGDGFVRAIKMVIAPIVFCTVTTGIAHMGDLKRFGRLGVKTLIYFEVLSTVALLMGLLVGVFVHPGKGFAGASFAPSSQVVGEYVQKAHGFNVQSLFLNLIPESFVGAFTGGELVQVVVLACLSGFALLKMGERGKGITATLHKASEFFFSVIGVVVRFAPLGAFGAMAFTIGAYGTQSLLNLIYLIGTFYVTSILFVMVGLGAVCHLCRFSILRFLVYIKEELFVVLGTSSSESALPQLISKMEALGVSKSVAGLVIPAGYSFNLDGTNIYMTLASLFLAQATNTNLSPAQLATLLLVAMVTSKGASGVTGSGFVTLAATLSAVPSIPIASLALLVGVDRFMSECRALTNTVGNGVACVVIATMEGEINRDQMEAQLRAIAPPPA